MRSCFTSWVLALILALGAACTGVEGDRRTAEARPTEDVEVALHPLVGTTPPPFEVAKWLKGEPLERVEIGKVYLVDFWATWCGPCKAAIPHLTRLAKEHAGELEVVGVAVSERQKNAEDTSYVDVVARFVEQQGERMGYRVAVDTPDKRMHATWFKPTGTGGLPTAYVIDRAGRVAWTGIGAPKELERIVEAVLDGTFDPREEARREARKALEAEERSKRDIEAAKARGGSTDEKYPGYREAMERGDTAAAIASLDAAFRADPESEAAGAYQWKLMLLLQQGKDSRAGVEKYSRELLERHRENDDVVGFVSAVIVSTSEEVGFDAQLAHEAAVVAAGYAKEDSRWQQFALWRLGWAKFHVGQRDAAIAAVERALGNIERLKGKVEFDGLEDGCREALGVFRR